MQRLSGAALLVLFALIPGAQAFADPPQSQSAAKRLISRVCDLIESEADKNGLPKDFFARLIWKESRFDPNAVSPVGAEGIAQFMPGTAKMRGLADPFDIAQAIPASAQYLAEMKVGYGNLGLAAAAYNAGENRVSRWLASGGFLPMETESYVFDIMG
ncbi:MAG: lytic transglycosylase domain-containing protein, partial [Pseudomonadota bacterium]